MKTDVVIIGTGPAGIFTAYEMLQKGSKKNIVMVEKGQAIENRRCPKEKTRQCVSCKPYCHITTGFSGAGAFSDGKLSLSCEVGGDLPSLITPELAQDTIDYCDGIYLSFGADAKVEGVSDSAAVKEIRRNAIKAGLKLVDCPIRHLGTERAQDIYLAIERDLQRRGVTMLFLHECTNLILEKGACLGVYVNDPQGEPAGDIRRRYRGGNGPQGRGLAGAALPGARHFPPARHRGYRRACGGAQRGHGAGEQSAL